MIRLDMSWFFRMGIGLSALNQIKVDMTTEQLALIINQARPWLQQLSVDPTISASLRSIHGPLTALQGRLDYLWMRDAGVALTTEDYSALLNDIGRFDAVLTSELAIADAYWVKEKKPYSTLTLVSEGRHLFPPDLVEKVPEACADLQEAGKCLAFEIPTAAAFHIHRATEAVLRRYWQVVTGNAPKPKVRSIGVYLAALRQKQRGDPKVIAALSQMNELHRNPTIHPEEFLTTPEAIALIGMANSVVAAMLKAIPAVGAHVGQFALPDMLQGEAEHSISAAK